MPVQQLIRPVPIKIGRPRRLPTRDIETVVAVLSCNSSISQSSSMGSLASSLPTTVSGTTADRKSDGKTCQKTKEEDNKAHRKLNLGDVGENAHGYSTFRWTDFGHECWTGASSDN
jgi:hypothetical protein